MSSLAFLVTKLQRNTAEASGNSRYGPQSFDLLKPVFMGCATKSPKVVAISLGSLQRLISLKAVPKSTVPEIIRIMGDAMNQGVDIQLKILQTLLGLITNYLEVHNTLLGNLQESRIAVVSSMATATLRQLVMVVMDKMVDEDHKNTDAEIGEADNRLAEITLPDGTTTPFSPSAKDAYSVFEDLCLLANLEKPNFLKLESLHKTFALELIESVLTNYHALFRKALSDRPTFPLILRCTRVVFLLLKQFCLELQTEAEVFLMLLIGIITDDNSVSLDTSGSRSSIASNESYGHNRMTSVDDGACNGDNARNSSCSDAELMHNVWDRYDAQEHGSNALKTLITALKRLVTEKPALLGGSAYSLDGVVGMVATAASATVPNVVGMIGSNAGLSLQGSTMKLQCIDQLDKADSPPIPESYVYLLAVQCLVSVCEGFATFAAPLYNTIIIQKPCAAGEAPIRAPPALDFTSLSSDDPLTKQLQIVRDIIESNCPALLAALSFVIATNLCNEIFVDILASYQAMTNVSGMLGLTTPRDAFFTSLAKFSVPTRTRRLLALQPLFPKILVSTSPGLSERNLACLKVLISSSMFLAESLGESWFGILEVLQNADYVLTSKGIAYGVQTPGSKGGAFSPGRGGHTTPSRSVSMALSSSGSGLGLPSAALSSSQQPSPRHPLLSDLVPEMMLTAIQRLFNASKNLEDGAFKFFTDALCKLSAEMIGMQTGTADGLGLEVIAETGSVEELSNLDGVVLSPPAPSIADTPHRRRVSGIHLPRTLRSGDFGINKLGGVISQNIHRLVYRPPEVAWTTITTHLLSVIRLPTAPPPIRIQAARVLDDILITVPHNLGTAGELQAQVQQRVLEVLSYQVIPDYTSLLSAATANVGTTVELRRMGLETLHEILQVSGHTLIVGWETIFSMLETSPTASPPRAKPILLGLGVPSEKNYTTLIKVAFQSLNLDNSGGKPITNIALTVAASLLWSVSDAIQAKRKDAEKEPEYSALWMFLLLEVLGLCSDDRPEVGDGEIQTLFRTMQLYGASLSPQTWDECNWKVTFPLVDSLSTEIRRRSALVEPFDGAGAGEQAWDESKILAFNSIGSIFHDFLSSKLVHLESFHSAWDTFVTRIQDSVLLDHRSISTPALRCLEKAGMSVKLKYDCPSPSKHGKDVKECAPQVIAFDEDVFRGGILPDCSTAESFPLDIQEEEENFDLSLVTSLKIDVVPQTLSGAQDLDYYDVSVVDGFNVPIAVTVSNTSCSTASCPADLNSDCPADLQVLDSSGAVVGCNSACNANLDGDQPDSANCCTGSHDTAANCSPSGITDYDFFKDACPNSYVYAYDESSGTALWTCPDSTSPDYTLTFCP
ncbi:thaumatin family-domain-containing protein [Lentinula edodes]|nr:thaumatin family-domain-containing protein [Lentinula edodes]